MTLGFVDFSKQTIIIIPMKYFMEYISKHHIVIWHSLICEVALNSNGATLTQHILRAYMLILQINRSRNIHVKDIYNQFLIDICFGSYIFITRNNSKFRMLLYFIDGIKPQKIEYQNLFWRCLFFRLVNIRNIPLILFSTCIDT